MWLCPLVRSTKPIYRASPFEPEDVSRGPFTQMGGHDGPGVPLVLDKDFPVGGLNAPHTMEMTAVDGIDDAR